MIKNILWDFDGVILDSMPVRDEGFSFIFNNYPSDLVAKLLSFHRENGGLSRFVKIKYFYNQILQKPITQEKIDDYASKFSEIMLAKLANRELLIEDSVRFIKKNSRNFNFHIVSGSEQKELRQLAKSLNIENYFLTINGSPTPKKDLVSSILKEHNYRKPETCLIGDSINDYDAAAVNEIQFIGYNNISLKEKLKEQRYLESMDTFLQL